MTAEELRIRIAAMEERVVDTYKNLHGARQHRVAIAATNHYLRAIEELRALVHKLKTTERP